MDRFNEHFRMDEEAIKVYVVEKLKLFENIEDIIADLEYGLAQIK